MTEYCVRRCVLSYTALWAVPHTSVIRTLPCQFPRLIQFSIFTGRRCRIEPRQVRRLGNLRDKRGPTRLSTTTPRAHRLPLRSHRLSTHLNAQYGVYYVRKDPTNRRPPQWNGASGTPLKPNSDKLPWPPSATAARDLHIMMLTNLPNNCPAEWRTQCPRQARRRPRAKAPVMPSADATPSATQNGKERRSRCGPGPSEIWPTTDPAPPTWCNDWGQEKKPEAENQRCANHQTPQQPSPEPRSARLPLPRCHSIWILVGVTSIASGLQKTRAWLLGLHWRLLGGGPAVACLLSQFERPSRRCNILLLRSSYRAWFFSHPRVVRKRSREAHSESSVCGVKGKGARRAGPTGLHCAKCTHILRVLHTCTCRSCVYSVAPSPTFLTLVQYFVGSNSGPVRID
jgi:hypothetical protein